MRKYLPIIGLPILVECFNFLIARSVGETSPFIVVSFFVYAFLPLFVGYRAALKLDDASLMLCAQLGGVVAVVDFLLAAPIVLFGWPLLPTLKHEPVAVGAFAVSSGLSLIYTAMLGALGGYAGRSWAKCKQA
jgi:hypothetical protein